MNRWLRTPWPFLGLLAVALVVLLARGVAEPQVDVAAVSIAAVAVVIAWSDSQRARRVEDERRKLEDSDRARAHVVARWMFEDDQRLLSIENRGPAEARNLNVDVVDGQGRSTKREAHDESGDSVDSNVGQLLLPFGVFPLSRLPPQGRYRLMFRQSSQRGVWRLTYQAVVEWEDETGSHRVEYPLSVFG